MKSLTFQLHFIGVRSSGFVMDICRSAEKLVVRLLPNPSPLTVDPERCNRLRGKRSLLGESLLSGGKGVT